MLKKILENRKPEVLYTSIFDGQKQTVFSWFYSTNSGCGKERRILAGPW